MIRIKPVVNQRDELNLVASWQTVANHVSDGFLFINAILRKRCSLGHGRYQLNKEIQILTLHARFGITQKACVSVIKYKRCCPLEKWAFSAFAPDAKVFVFLAERFRSIFSFIFSFFNWCWIRGVNGNSVGKMLPITSLRK